MVYEFEQPSSIPIFNSFIHAFGSDLSNLGRGLVYHHISIVVDKSSSFLTVFKAPQSEYFIIC